MITHQISRINRPVLAALTIALCALLAAAALAEPKTYRPSGRDGARVQENAPSPGGRVSTAPQPSTGPTGSQVFRGGSGGPSPGPAVSSRPAGPSPSSSGFSLRRPPESTTVTARPVSRAPERPSVAISTRESAPANRPAGGAVSTSAGSFRRANSDYVAPRPTDGAPTTSAGSVRRAAQNDPVSNRPAVTAPPAAAIGSRAPTSSSNTTSRPAVRPTPNQTTNYRPPAQGTAVSSRPVERTPSSVPGVSHRPAGSESRPTVKSGDTTYRPDSKAPPRDLGSSSYRPISGSPTRGGDYSRDRDDNRRAEPARFSPKPYRPDPVRPRYVPAPAPRSYKPPTYSSGYYYYPKTYYSRPCYYPYWTFGYYSGFSVRSIYFHYGYFPYITITRVIDTSYPRVVYVDTPIYVRSGYYLESRRSQELDNTLADIRSAWIAGRFDLIQRHVRSDRRIAVLLDGEYDYSVESDDYLRMTRDAIEHMDTASFVWDWVRERSDGGVTAFASHVYYDSSGRERTVYVSYTLHRSGSRYYITEVGSSLNPLY